jgi:nucleoside-diphosphate-sugar epimerase
MNVLVIGGSRFIGPPVVQRLAEGGHNVTIFNRGQSPTSASSNVKTILGDRRKLADSIVALRQTNPDIVLDMIPFIESDARDIIEAFRGFAKRIIAISSMDVYQAFGRIMGTETGELESEALTEESPLRTKLYPYRGEIPRENDDPKKLLDYYDKIPIEHIVLSDPELIGTVLRLPMVYGPSDYQHRLYGYLRSMVDKRDFILLDEGFAGWRSTRGYVEDIADAIVRAVVDEPSRGEVFNVADNQFHSEREWVELIAKAMDWQGEIRTMPSEALPESLRSNLDTRQHLMVDSSKIRDRLRWSHRTDVIVAIQETAN